MVSDLSVLWVGEVYASEWRGGACHTPVSRELVSASGRFSERWRFKAPLSTGVRILARHEFVDTVHPEKGEDAARSVHEPIMNERTDQYLDELQCAATILNPASVIPLIPALAGRVFDAHWRVLFLSPWSRMEHITVLEARALAQLVSVIGRRARGHATHGTCRALRSTAVIALTYELPLAMRWVPSEINVADKPNRRGLRPFTKNRPHHPAARLRRHVPEHHMAHGAQSLSESSVESGCLASLLQSSQIRRSTAGYHESARPCWRHDHCTLQKGARNGSPCGTSPCFQWEARTSSLCPWAQRHRTRVHLASWTQGISDSTFWLAPSLTWRAGHSNDPRLVEGRPRAGRCCRGCHQQGHATVSTMGPSDASPCQTSFSGGWTPRREQLTAASACAHPCGNSDDSGVGGNKQRARRGFCSRNMT